MSKKLKEEFKSNNFILNKNVTFHLETLFYSFKLITIYIEIGNIKVISFFIFINK